MTRYKKELRQQVYDKFNGLCAYTGRELGDDWQIDHITSKAWADYYGDTKTKSAINDISNLFPSLWIVNHYKRALDLEAFRNYMLSFHLRLAKLPKNTNVYKTQRRKAYMYEISKAFGITPEKPFCGKFYFETLK